MSTAPTTKDHDPDADVLELVAQGHGTPALRLLMHRYGKKVYRYCRVALQDEARAEDVQQRVFIEVHRDLPTFGRQSLLKTWMFTIARNRVIDEIRSRARRPSVEHDDTADVADPAPSTGERLDDERLYAALVECVKELPEPTREAVLLRFQQSFSFEEMAEILGEKAGTLQARVARALPRLQTCIQKRTGGSL